MLANEINANFQAFLTKWKNDLPISINALSGQGGIFLDSYTRITALNAWKVNLFEVLELDKESVLFFTEALNDALVSHVFASMGSWRASLSSMRSVIENTMFFLYYKDHPVELKLWDIKKHKLGFTEMQSYLESHPAFISVANKTTVGLIGLKEEYSTLSRAVHASAKGFRMSHDLQQIAFWKPDTVALNQWATRQRATIKNVNLLLLTCFREHLTGTRQSALRKVIGLSMSDKLKMDIATALGVKIS